MASVIGTVGEVVVIRPRHDVRCARLDLLITAWASICLDGSSADDVPNEVVPSIPLHAFSDTPADRTTRLRLATSILARHRATLPKHQDRAQ